MPCQALCWKSRLGEDPIRPIASAFESFCFPSLSSLLNVKSPVKDVLHKTHATLA